MINETRAALIDYFFDKLEDRRRTAVTQFCDKLQFKAQVWVYEDTLRGHFKSVVDGSPLDQLRFRLLPHE